VKGWWFRLQQTQQFTGRSRGSFYRLNLKTLLVITCLPLLIIGASIYFGISGRIQADLHEIHVNRIHQTVQSMDNQFNYLEMTLSHWAFDPVFGNRLGQLDFVRGYSQIHDLYRTLLVMRGTSPLIDQVELILLRPEPLLFNTERYWALNDSAQEHYEQVAGSSQTMQWIHTENSLNLAHSIPGDSLHTLGLLQVTLNGEQIRQMLQTLDPYSDGLVFLMQQEGDVINSDKASNSLVALEELLRESVLSRNEESGSFIYDWQDSKYSVMYGSLKRLDQTWTYVSAAELTAITGPVIVMSRTIVLLGAAGLLLALLLSWFASNYLYRPIAELRQHMASNREIDKHDGHDELAWIRGQWNEVTLMSDSLQQKLERQRPYLREIFVLQLLQGQLYSLQETEIRRRLENDGLSIGKGKLAVIVVHLAGFGQLSKRFAPGDEGLVSFAAANIVEELVKKRFPHVQLVRIEDFWLGLLIIIPENWENIEAKLELQQLASQLMEEISRHIGFSVTVSLSPIFDQLREAGNRFEETKRAISFRHFGQMNQVIDVERLQQESPDSGVYYPVALEKQLLHTLRTGDADEANDLFADFIDQLSKHDRRERAIREGISYLIGSIQHMMLAAGVDPRQVYGVVGLQEQLETLHSADEVGVWFRDKVVRLFFDHIRSRENDQWSVMVNKTLLRMQESYGDDQLSLESCAEEFGTTSYTLSKVFRQGTGHNFIDYLTTLRMDKAKELLRDTDTKVNDIALQVGYQSSYFHRIFKKHEGVTPSQYRDKHRK